MVVSSHFSGRQNRMGNRRDNFTIKRQGVTCCSCVPLPVYHLIWFLWSMIDIVVFRSRSSCCIPSSWFTEDLAKDLWELRQYIKTVVEADRKGASRLSRRKYHYETVEITIFKKNKQTMWTYSDKRYAEQENEYLNLSWPLENSDIPPTWYHLHTFEMS